MSRHTFKPRVCVLRSAGTNCDLETVHAFSVLGCEVESVHVNKLIEGKKALAEFHILALPGGFTYGDDIAAGKVFANELRFKLGRQFRDFVATGKLVIGICNGFQILVKSGFLPGNPKLEQETSLIINDSGSFQDRWVHLKSETRSVCVWTSELPGVIYLPIAHGEGKFVVKDDAVLARLKKNGQVVFRYCSAEGELKGYNPNGSLESIAGICDETGRIFGLMPHPERHIDQCQHPRWESAVPCAKGGAGTRPHAGTHRCADGLLIFRNGVEYVRKNFGR
ncbi:MAG: phosphoribosylformylglycinamidine synthase I [Deltaproteobacteria bacterium]